MTEDSGSKKRVNSTTTNSPSKKQKTSSTTSKPPPSEAMDKKVFNYEETEADRVDSGEDLKHFSNVCNQMKHIVTNIERIKTSDTSAKNPDVLRRRVEASLLTSEMKRLNRYAQLRGRKAKDDTNEVKSKVDGLHLRLQNLYYEVIHMKKEIEQCVNFTSRDEEIDLLPVDQFYQNAPAEVSKPDATRTDSHQQMLARLDWELKERQRLSSEKEEVVAKKSTIEVDIQKKRDELTSLKPRLNQIMKATLSVQDFMKLPIEAERIQFETAQFLPRPLYVMYVQMKAYTDACDAKLVVEIVGTVQQAKDFRKEQEKEDQGTTQEDSDVEDDQMETNEKEESKSRRTHKKEKAKSRLMDKQRKLLLQHPLSVKAKIICQDSSAVTLQFFYLPNLNICTVKVDLGIGQVKGMNTSSSLLSPSVLLRDLLCLDTGLKSPNPNTDQQLESADMKTFSEYVPTIGYPYYWVQWITGLHFLPDQQTQALDVDAKVSFKHIESVITAVRARLTTRIALQTQLSQLESLTIPQSSKSSLLLPPKVVSQLTSWKKITFEDFKALPFTHDAIESDLVDDNCSIYQARFTREEILDVAIVLFGSYPASLPLFLVGVGNGAVSKVVPTAQLKNLECEVNTHVEEFLEMDDPNMILSNQLRKLQVCYDMLIETGDEFPTREKLYARKTRGRDRNRPYLYNREGYFTHR